MHPIIILSKNILHLCSTPLIIITAQPTHRENICRVEYLMYSVNTSQNDFIKHLCHATIEWISVFTLKYRENTKIISSTNFWLISKSFSTLFQNTTISPSFLWKTVISVISGAVKVATSHSHNNRPTSLVTHGLWCTLVKVRTLPTLRPEFD